MFSLGGFHFNLSRGKIKRADTRVNLFGRHIGPPPKYYVVYDGKFRCLHFGVGRRDVGRHRRRENEAVVPMLQVWDHFKKHFVDSIRQLHLLQ